MPHTLAHDCPHCGTKKVAFSFFTSYQSSNRQYIDQGIYICAKCDEVLVVKAINVNNATFSILNVDASDLMDGYPFEVLFFPKDSQKKCPENTPSNIQKIYDQASQNLNQQNWDAAAMVFRRSLELATKNIMPDSSKLKLKARIDKAAEEERITKDMKNWAHTIRIMGNEANHEEGLFEESDAKDIAAFTEVFLMYVYTLPGMLEKRRAKSSE